MTAGTRGRPWFNSLCHGLQLLRVEDQPEGAMALGTPHLGPGGDRGATSVVGVVPRGLGSFQVHKGLASVNDHASTKGRAPAIPERSGITLLQEPGVVNLQLVSLHSACAPFPGGERARVLPAGPPRGGGVRRLGLAYLIDPGIAAA